MRSRTGWEVLLVVALVALAAWWFRPRGPEPAAPALPGAASPPVAPAQQAATPPSGPPSAAAASGNSIDALTLDQGLQEACFRWVIEHSEAYRREHAHPEPARIFLRVRQGTDPDPRTLENLARYPVAPASGIPMHDEAPFVYWVISLDEVKFREVARCEVKAGFEESHHRWGSGFLLEACWRNGRWTINP